MTRYAFTGPSRLRPGDSLTISETVYGLAAPTELLTGCADGADTLVALLGAAFWKETPQRLFIPTAPSNARAVASALEALGVVYTVKITPPGPPARAGATDAAAYRVRNEAMVGACEKLVAFVRASQFYRSGEWMTVNIAHRAGVPFDLVVL